MNYRLLTSSTLAAAVTLALATQTMPTRAADAAAVEKCYGINAVAKNDCKAGAHDCAGHATKERDPASFVVVPAGACSKIAGGKTQAG